MIPEKKFKRAATKEDCAVAKSREKIVVQEVVGEGGVVVGVLKEELRKVPPYYILTESATI